MTARSTPCSPILRRATLATLVLAGVLSSCDSTPTAPGVEGAHRAALAVSPQLPSGFDFRRIALVPDRALVAAIRPETGDTLDAKVVEIPIGGEPSSATLDVQLRAESEMILIVIEVMAQQTVLLRADEEHLVSANQTTEVLRPQLNYVGPGASARSIQVEPQDAVVETGSTLLFDAVGLDDAGQPIQEPVYVDWSTSDPSASIDRRGLLTAPSHRATFSVRATQVGTNATGSAQVFVQPAPTTIDPVGGPNVVLESGQATTLTVRVTAADGMGVRRIPVSFHLTQGSGTLASSEVHTDSIGEASVAFVASSRPGTTIVEASLVGVGSIPLSVQVLDPPQIQLTPDTISFTARQGSNPNSPNSALTITNTGGSPLEWTATGSQGWVTVSQPSGTLAAGASQSIAVAVNASGLASGTHTASVIVSGADQVVTRKAVVQVQVIKSAEISLSARSFDFATSAGIDPSPQTLTITNVGGQPLSWTISDTAAWLQATPSSSPAPLQPGQSVAVRLGASVSGQVAGLYRADLVVSSNEASNSPQVIPVSLTIAAVGGIAGRYFIDADRDGVFSHGDAYFALSGATVRLSTGASTATDAAGAYAFTGLPAGHYGVTPDTVTRVPELRFGAPVPLPATVVAHQAALVDLPLVVDSVTGTVHVVDASGAPLSGVNVEVFRCPGGTAPSPPQPGRCIGTGVPQVFSGSTDRQGVYRFRSATQAVYDVRLARSQPQYPGWTHNPPSLLYGLNGTQYSDTGTFTLTRPLPDLWVSSSTLTIHPDTVFAGDSVTVGAWSAANRGGASSAFTNGFYLSTDSTITAGDVLIGTNRNSGLGAGGSFDWGAHTLTIPSSTSPGTYYLGVLVDRADAVAESDEQNNFVARRIVVRAPHGRIVGQVRNAADGRALPGVTVQALGSGTSLGGAVTDAAGRYQLTVPPGPVAVSFTLGGFIPVQRSVQVNPGQDTRLDVAMSPTLAAGKTRIVLSWGATPLDLDAHLVGPRASGGTFWLYYNTRARFADSTAAPFATLDVDDVDGHGPETVTVHQQQNGTYCYAVHHYSGVGSIAASGAMVEVFRGNTSVARFSAPASSGTLWTVFKLDGNGLTTVNSMSDPGLGTPIAPTCP